MKADAKSIKDKIHKIVIGQESTVVLPQRLKLIHDRQLWRELTRADGLPFESFGEFLLANFPYGVGVEQTKDCMTLEQLRSFCVGYMTLERAIAELIAKKPRPKMGRPEKSLSDNDIKAKQGTSSAYLLQRLKRDHEEVFDRYIAGEFASVKAAAREAGIVSKQPVGHDPLMRMKAYWRKASKEQREEFRKWLRSKEASQ